MGKGRHKGTGERRGGDASKGEEVDRQQQRGKMGTKTKALKAKERQQERRGQMEMHNLRAVSCPEHMQACDAY